MLMKILEFIFWSSLFVIFYTYFGYLVLLSIVAVFSKKKVIKEETFPYVSLIISLYNEEKMIVRKLESCFALDYPADKYEILVGSDGSTDSTNEILNQFALQGKIKFYEFKNRRGKPSVLNDLVESSKGEILLFNDARQIIDKNALKELVSNFADEDIGCVSGNLIFTKEDDNEITAPVDFYWRYEKLLRQKESQIGSMIGATGAIYAIRKVLYEPIPNDLILDDVFIPLHVVSRGYRAVFEEKALIFDKISLNANAEFTRKVRTLGGNWQIFAYFLKLFNPITSKVAIQILSHKLLRVIVPLLFILVFFLNILLVSVKMLYSYVFYAQLIFYLFAIIGWIFRRKRIKIFNVPYAFCLLNWAALLGFIYYKNKKLRITWR